MDNGRSEPQFDISTEIICAECIDGKIKVRKLVVGKSSMGESEWQFVALWVFVSET